MRAATAIAALLVVVAAPARPQSVDAGHDLARRWCSGCHDIGEAPARNDATPSFRAVARTPGMTTMSLTAFLSTPHHRMPDYSLTRREIADVSAYIVSLK